MNTKTIVAVALLGGLVGACSGEVQIQSTSTGAMGGSSETGGMSSSSSSSSGTGGTGGGCSVSLPVGCGCPDNTAGAWAQTFTVPGDNETTLPAVPGALSIAPDGSTVLLLETDEVNGDTGMLTSAQLVRLDVAGNIVWGLPAGPLWSPTPDPRDCSTVVTGWIAGGTTELLGQTISCSTAGCPFVARIDAAGSVVWSKVYDFGGDGWTTPVIAGVLADGRIALAGPFQGTIDLGNGPLVAPPHPGSGVFVALLSSDGDALWSSHFSKENTFDFLAAAVVSPAGEISVAVTPDGAVDFGDGPIAVPGMTYFGGLALAAYDPTGALRFGKVIHSANESLYPSLAQSSAGHLIVSQSVYGGTDFGGGPIGVDPSVRLLAVAAFDADGQHLWSTGIDADYGLAPAVDPAKHVWLGVSSGEIVELDAAGTLVAMHSLGGSGKHFASGIGFAPGGVPVIAGGFDDTLDLGSGAPVVAQSKYDAFVARLVP